MIITITGQIGSGKNSVTSILNKNNYYTVIDADSIGHEVLEIPKVINKIAKAFPVAVKNSKVDRKRLGAIVFPEKIQTLNDIVHPFLIEKIKSKIQKNSIINAALLEELKLKEVSDLVILVESTEETIIKRLKDKLSPLEIKKRLKTQKPISWYRRQADIIIYNNGTLDNLKKEIANKCQNLI